MFLRIITPTEDAATLLIETAIQNKIAILSLQAFAGPQKGQHAVYFRGQSNQLTDFRKNVVRQNYFDHNGFDFRTDKTLAGLSSTDEA